MKLLFFKNILREISSRLNCTYVCESLLCFSTPINSLIVNLNAEVYRDPSYSCGCIFTYARFLKREADIVCLVIFVFSGSPWTHDSYEQFDCAINTALALLKDLKCSWYNILPNRMYEMSMCTLVQVLCQSVLDRVLAAIKPVSEELVYMLAMRVDDTLADVLTLFEVRYNLEKCLIHFSTLFGKLDILMLS